MRVIATSNVTNVKDTHFDYTLNYNSLIDQNAEIIDNSFVMLNVLTKTSVHHAACADSTDIRSMETTIIIPRWTTGSRGKNHRVLTSM